MQNVTWWLRSIPASDGKESKLFYKSEVKLYAGAAGVNAYLDPFIGYARITRDVICPSPVCMM